MAEDGPFVEGQAIDEQDEWDVQVPGAAPEPVEVGLHGALRVPTLMHVVSNASNDMLVGAEVLQESVEQLSAVVKLMDSKHSRARLKAIHVSVVFDCSCCVCRLNRCVSETCYQAQKCHLFCD